MNSKIGIIGSQGYIGSFLANEFKNNGYRIYNFSKIFRNVEQDNLIIIKGKDISNDIIQSFDIIIYVAGISGIKSCSQYTLDELINENVNDIYDVATKMNPNQLLIYTSTAIIAEGSGEYLMKENDKVYEKLFNVYSESYYMREQKLSQINNGPKCIGLRLGTVIGISPVQYLIIYLSMIRNAFLKGVITVQNPDCMRGILWMRDLYNVIETIIKQKSVAVSGIYNIVSFNCSIARIANEIARATGAPIDFQHSEINSIGFSLDNSLFCNRFNFKFEGNHNNIINELLSNIEHICDDSIKSLTHNSVCRVCKSSSIIPILDLNNQPLANSFTSEPIQSETYPLRLERCKECNHAQLNYVVPSDKMFSHYLYISGTSNTIKEYFNWLANKCINECHKKTGIVLELASNDGSQLDVFKKLGWDTYGVDPAINLSDIAINKGHHIHVGYWGIDKFSLPNPDIIIAQNVLAHVPDPILFLRECFNIMDDNTKLYIQTSQCNMFMTGEFDTIYHEHLSFFTGHSFRRAAEIVGLMITNFEITPIHGNSFLVTMEKNKLTHCESLMKRIRYEEELGMNKNFFWIRYRNKALLAKEWLEKYFFPLQNQGFLLAAYGAAAKGMTLLNYINIKGISFIIDDAPLKQNTYCPGMQIPIFNTNKLSEYSQPLAILILAWNFLDEIISNIRKMRPNNITLIITPFPKQTIYYIHQNGIRKILSNDISQLTYPIPNNIPKTLMICHFYNEELLLPYFIRHHAPLFDEVILIDYDSTDKSLEIIKKEAPSGWRVVLSKNRDFDAIDVDKEITEYENSYPSNWWKIALTCTEFIIYPNFKNELNKYSEPCNFKLHSFIMNGRDDHKLEMNLSLLKQRCQYQIIEPLGLTCYSRFISYKFDKQYAPGRHSIYNEGPQTLSMPNTGFICKYMSTPWPESKNRKLQIGKRIPQRARDLGMGWQHYQDPEIIIINILQNQKEPSSLMNVITLDDLKNNNDFSHVDLVNIWCNSTFSPINFNL